MSMYPLILASESAAAAATTPPGDEFLTASLVMLGIAMIVTAIATWRVTPKAEHH
jgi:hypothetical protein